MSQEVPKATVADVPDDLTLVTGSVEVRHVLDHLGYDDKDLFGCLFVGTEAGDYTEVWACRSAVPFLHHTAYKIR